MRAYLRRRSFDELCVLTTLAAASLAGLLTFVGYCVYDQAGDA